MKIRFSLSLLGRGSKNFFTESVRKGGTKKVYELGGTPSPLYGFFFYGFGGSPLAPLYGRIP